MGGNIGWEYGTFSLCATEILLAVIIILYIIGFIIWFFTSRQNFTKGTLTKTAKKNLKNPLIALPLALLIWSALSILWSYNRMLAWNRCIILMEGIIVYLFIIKIPPFFKEGFIFPPFFKEGFKIPPFLKGGLGGISPSAKLTQRENSTSTSNSTEKSPRQNSGQTCIPPPIQRAGLWERGNWLFPLLAGAIIQSILAIYQFISQQVVANKWLGIASHLPETLGTSVVETPLRRWLRSYGSLPHPNMLAAYLGIALLFFIISHFLKEAERDFRNSSENIESKLTNPSNYLDSKNLINKFPSNKRGHLSAELAEGCVLINDNSYTPLTPRHPTGLPPLKEGNYQSSYTNTEELKQRLLGIIKVFAVFLIAVAIIFTFSRAVWIGLFLSAIIFLILNKILLHPDKILRHPELAEGSHSSHDKRCSALASQNSSPRKAEIKMTLKNLPLIPAVGFFILFLFTLFLAREPIISRLKSSNRLEKKSNQEHILSYKEGADIIKENWMLGVGIGNYTYAEYKKNPNLPVYAYQPAHNLFMLLWAELGLIGLFIFIIFLFFIIKQHGLKTMLNISLITFLMVIMLFDHYFWSLYFGVILFWLTMGILSTNPRSV